MTYRSLFCENLKIITVKRSRISGVGFLDLFGGSLADRSAPFSVRVLPCQPVLFARRADDALGILVDQRAVVLCQRVFMLGFDIAATNFDGVQLVSADSPVQNLLASGLGVEIPCTAFPDNWYRKLPVVLADRH